ncbi:MAG: hypothetical protein M1546_24570 [Chloroflexi bacterium]|nr:hypothetical protein [Chloroflexota bacterium]
MFKCHATPIVRPLIVLMMVSTHFVATVFVAPSSTRGQESSPSPAITSGDTVAARDKALLQDEDRILLTLNNGEQSVVEGVLGKCALLSVDRSGKRIRGWAQLESLTMVKRHEASATPYCDRAGNCYYCIPLGKMTFVDGKCPWDGWRPIEKALCAAMYPRVVIDGIGEGYVAFEPCNLQSLTSDGIARSGWLVVRAPRGRDVAGWLHFPLPDADGTARFRFTISQTAADTVGDGMFRWGETVHYAALAKSGSPGGAWFRYQAGWVADQRGVRLHTTAADRSGSDVRMELTRTFDFFSGGRALAENLRLDRRLAEPGKEDKTVAIGTIRGISIPSFDWTPLLKGAEPSPDNLAKHVPYDQHVVFFPSLKAALALSDEATKHDTPLLQFAEPRSENAHVIERYQGQLGLQITDLERIVAPHLIRTVALTGSDPFFAMGTDVAMLFEAAQPAALEQSLWIKILLAASAHPTVNRQKSEIDGLSYRAVVSPDRRISSFLVRWDNVVRVTTSLYQVQRLADIRHGRYPSIATLPEYRFFRTRYPVEAPQETALVFLSDAAIRRWCSPEWRIADSRRTRAAAAIADLQAAHLETLVSGKIKPSELKPTLLGIDLGTVSLTNTGVTSSIYGTLEFLYPVSELALDAVTQAEADAYNRWRDAFERDWRFAFDPVAVRVEVAADRLAADMTVMPLIANSNYRFLIALARGANIDPQSGDRHAALLHGIAAVNRSSDLIKGVGGFLVSSWEPKVSLEWLGPTAELYIDPDPFWQALARFSARQDATVAERTEFLNSHQGCLPVAVRLAVIDRTKARAFLDGARKQWKKSQGDKLGFDELTYRGQEYSRVVIRNEKPSITKLYAYLTDDSFLLTLSESLLQRAIDRQLARVDLVKQGNHYLTPVDNDNWLGAHLCLRVDRELLEVANSLSRGEYQRAMQRKAWDNLPILNEWKRLFSNEDPMAVHRRIWHIELVCPGRGHYVWNDDWKTMESTVYGHPGQPKVGPPASPVLSTFASGNFGIEFEEHGLRARVSLQRGKSQKQD